MFLYDTPCHANPRRISTATCGGLSCHSGGMTATNHGGENEGSATAAETRAALLPARRTFVPIRNPFVQKPLGGATRAGPLADFVRRSDLGALQAYLFVHGVASTPPWNCDYPADVWVRALDRGKSAEPDSARGAISKIWARLEKQKLIKRGQRRGRTASIILLREDGSGQDYTRPTGHGDDRYFKLPHAFWLEDWHEILDLTATAMLLIALTLKDNFYLPYEKAKPWYGISPKSAEQGLNALCRHKLLSLNRRWVKAPRSATGRAERRLYTLNSPFSSAERAAMRWPPISGDTP